MEDVITKKKGNKCSRNTTHVFAILVDLIFTFYPLTFGIVMFFVSQPVAVEYIAYIIGIAFNFYNTKNFAGRYLGKIRWHTYVVDGKTYYYFENMLKDG